MSRTRARLAVIAGALLLAGCSGGGGPGGERRFRYAEAAEVPAAVDDRDELAAIVAGFAQRNGLAFHDTSPRAARLSNGRQTLAFEVQRPLTNGRLWQEVEVTAIGNAPALITFKAPLDSGITGDSEQGRAALLAELRRRWPATRPVALHDGGLPRQD